MSKFCTLIGDCIESMRGLPDASVNCCVTSPPYYWQRDYGVEGQIGLEDTPDAFVARLVDVFREVRRVLRDDGTLWLNLGDSYARTGGTDRRVSDTAKVGSTRNTLTQMSDRTGKAPVGLKDKDLIGIPWRVAFALQQPYYTGRIMDERERIWLAAMIDAEGCLFIHRRKAGQNSGARHTRADGTTVSYARTQDTYAAGVEVYNTSLAIVERCRRIAGVGSISKQESGRRQALYRWTARANECRDVVSEVYPYLIAKKHQARVLLGCPSGGKAAEAAHGALILLHNGGLTDVDFAAPESLFQPGYYLRQDVIWSKPNPMPESVRDRCTKAHEYMFLLSKGPRYYFDSKAMKEPGVIPAGTKGAKGSAERAAQTGVNSRPPEYKVYDGMRNRRSVWTVTTKPFKGAHFATFPPDLIEPCILAGCPVGGTVLDPFGGSGTTAGVAIKHGRNAILCELNPEYAALVNARVDSIAGSQGTLL